jgi:hypothetical protein
VEDIKRLIMNNNHLSDETKLYILKDKKGGDMNEATDEEVRNYGKKIKNSSMVLDYIEKLFNNGQISTEIALDFHKAIRDVLKRYHDEINGRRSDDEMDDITKTQMSHDKEQFRRETGGMYDN